MKQTIQLFKRNRILIGQDLIRVQEILDAGDEAKYAEELNELGRSVSRRFGITAGLFFALKEASTPEVFGAVMKTLGVEEYEEHDLLNAATDAEG